MADHVGVVERSVELDGLVISLLEAGVGGSPLLLVHGFTGCKEDFADEVGRLAGRGFHVVAPDLRGHGSSSKPAAESAYGLARFTEDVVALVDHLGWARFDLLGHSMGGMIAQLLVLDHPERVDRLVLMDTHHGRLEHVDFALVPLGVELARTKGLEVIQQLLDAAADPADNAPYERVCAERPGYREWSEQKMLRSSAAMYAAMLAGFEAAEDRLERLAALRHRTLVMVGEGDRGFVGAAERMADRMSDARLVRFAGAGHCPQFESTEAWRAALDEFLARGT